MRIVIPGGSGQVGHILARYFHSAGHEVVVLSRNPKRESWQVLPWDGYTAGDWTRTLEGTDVCINLTGRSVNCRYHTRNRREILKSRTQSTHLLSEVIAALRHPPKLWINASTATIYRHALDRDMDELSGELGGNEPGAPETWNFSINVAKAWEEAFFSIETRRTRKIAIRSAMTFSPDSGGVFDVLLRLVRLGFGGGQGAGTQFVSWIHDLDFARAVDWLIGHDALAGVVNLTSPNPLPNREFMRILTEAWGASVALPVPEPLVELGAIFLRTESELILKSRRVVPALLPASGFQFVYPDWQAAARDLVDRWRHA